MLPFSFFTFSALFNAATSFVLLPVIIYGKSKSESAKYFLLFLLAVIEWSMFYALWLITSNPNIAEFFARTCMIGVLLMPPIFFHFIVSLIEKKNMTAWIITNYILAAIFVCSAYTPLYLSGMKQIILIPFWPIPGMLFSFAVAHFAIVYLITHLLMWKFIGQNKGSKKEQVLYVFIGTFIGGIAGASNFISWYTAIPPVLNVFTSVYITTIAYAITKHELMDIRVAITRGAAYGTVVILIILSFVFLNLLQMPRLLVISTNTILCLFWAFYASRLRTFIQTPLEEKWITGWYDLNKLMNRIAQELVSAMETQKVFEIIAEQLKNTIKIKEIKIFDNTELSLPPNEVIKYDDLNRELKEKLKVFANGVFIPLASSSEPKGILGLSQKISEDPYNEKDVLLFRTIMFQAVAIFDRVRSYEQIKHEFDSTQKKLFETEKMLSRSARLASLGTLTAGVTHEIRNPLGVIRGSTEDISKTEQTKESISIFQKLVLSHVDRIANIVDKMLYLARSKEPVAKQVDINKLIEQYIVGIVSSKNVNISTQLNPVSIVLAIEDDIHQVLINLTNNAIKAMPDGGDLTIKTYEKKEEGSSKVVIEITDTGIGIPQENLEKIFDPFFSTYHEGTGLGLSISFKIVEELKGRIEVQSQVGKGSTFRIILPAAT